MTESSTTILLRLLDGFEHECFMLRVEATETRAKDEAVRKAYERIREESARAIAATLGRGECEVETTENWLPAERYHRCKNCGAFFAVLDASGDIPPCVCPNCGKAVKR